MSKRERCRWVAKVSDGPTPEQFFDYNPFEGAVIVVSECLLSSFSRPKSQVMMVGPGALDSPQQDVADSVLKTNINRLVRPHRPF